MATSTRLPRYDSIYVSPHAHDAVLSCLGRLLAETRRGLEVLMLVVFGPEGPGPGVYSPLAPDVVGLGLPEAPRRGREHESLRGILFGRSTEDGALVERIAHELGDLTHRVRARHVYVPLAAGGHVDHRLCHEAAARAFDGGGRDILFYEDRPYAFVRDAVRVRLGLIGAQLPPAATNVPERPNLTRHLFDLSRAAYVGRGTRTVSERLRCTMESGRQWREARSWRPQGALGLRLQPVLHVGEPGYLEQLAALASRLDSKVDPEALFWPSSGVLASQYGRRLGGPFAERYWLMLPPRARDGATYVTGALEERPVVY